MRGYSGVIPKNIENLIDDIEYQFESVDLLIECGRLRETIPFVSIILNRFSELDHLMSQGDTSSLKQFDDPIVLANDTSGRALTKIIHEFAESFYKINPKELKLLEYEDFIETLKKTVGRRYSAIRKKHETTAEKTRKKRVQILIVSIIFVIFFAYAIVQFVTRNYGLSGKFYAGMNFENKVDESLSKKIDFSCYGDFSKKVPHDHFSARWTGHLMVPKEDKYIFTVSVDDGIRLFVDEKIIIDYWKEHSGELSSNEISLKSGPHIITIEYFENSEAEYLKLYWSTKRNQKSIIESKYFRPPDL